MPTVPSVNEKEFEEYLKTRLGSSWDRALEVFRNYGRNLTFDVTNVLMHAADQEKTEEVLEILERHYKSHLQYQHPEIKGTVRDNLLGTNPTEQMFLRICEYTLKLQPNPA